MRNLLEHLSSVSSTAKVLVIGDQPLFDKALNNAGANVIAVDAGSQNIPLDGDFELVILVFNKNATALEVNAKCRSFKDRGIPVVFGHDQRGLFFDKSDWRSSDLTMAGMFYLASHYLTHTQETGAYAEFGVFDGRSFSCAYHNLKDICTGFIGFDSFAGICGALEDEEMLYRDGDYYANLETFWHNMKVAKVDTGRSEAVKGPFQQTLSGHEPADYGIDRIAVAHIDCDIAEPALLALEFISPALIDGALIMFDEYHAFSASNNRGERLAHRLWLENHPEFETELYRNYNPVARSYIVHRK